MNPLTAFALNALQAFGVTGIIIGLALLVTTAPGADR